MQRGHLSIFVVFVGFIVLIQLTNMTDERKDIGVI
jgi:hypothetical protein